MDEPMSSCRRNTIIFLKLCFFGKIWIEIWIAMEGTFYAKTTQPPIQTGCIHRVKCMCKKGLQRQKKQSENQQLPCPLTHMTLTHLMPWCGKTAHLAVRWDQNSYLQRVLSPRPKRTGTETEVVRHYNHGRVVLFCVSSFASARSHLPRLPVPPCSCVPSSLSALPAADIEDSLYLPGSSFDGNMHDTLKRVITKTRVSDVTIQSIYSTNVLAYECMVTGPTESNSLP